MIEAGGAGCLYLIARYDQRVARLDLDATRAIYNVPSNGRIGTAMGGSSLDCPGGRSVPGNLVAGYNVAAIFAKDGVEGKGTADGVAGNYGTTTVRADSYIVGNTFQIVSRDNNTVASLYRICDRCSGSCHDDIVGDQHFANRFDGSINIMD